MDELQMVRDRLIDLENENDDLRWRIRRANEHSLDQFNEIRRLNEYIRKMEGCRNVQFEQNCSGRQID